MLPKSDKLGELVRDPSGRFHQGQRLWPRLKVRIYGCTLPVLLVTSSAQQSRGRVGKWGATIYGKQLVRLDRYSGSIAVFVTIGFLTVQMRDTATQRRRA